MESGGTITIVGGGLAGLALGIGLRQRQVPVTVWEAKTYPRHKVCGEFISGQGQQVLARLGLLPILEKAGAIQARTARFFFENSSTPCRQIGPPALCISRFRMDQIFAEQFRELGGELRESACWRGDELQPGVVWASGRRVHATEKGWRWFGLKVHAREVRLEADLEMHSTPHGYVGLCVLPGGWVNICGLFRARSGCPVPAPDNLLRGEPGSALSLKMANAKLDPDTFCSVAGLAMRPQKAGHQASWRIGDALTLIPPVTGNGMSIALESAEHAVSPLVAYAAGQLGWDAARDQSARACDAAFGARLRWAQRLQWLMFSGLLRGPFGSLMLKSTGLWQLLFRHTR